MRGSEDNKPDSLLFGFTALALDSQAAPLESRKQLFSERPFMDLPPIFPLRLYPPIITEAPKTRKVSYPEVLRMDPLVNGQTPTKALSHSRSQIAQPRTKHM